MASRIQLLRKIPEPFDLDAVFGLLRTYDSGELTGEGGKVETVASANKGGNSLFIGLDAAGSSELFFRGDGESEGRRVLTHGELLQLTRRWPSNKIPAGFTEKDVYSLSKTPPKQMGPDVQWMLDQQSEPMRIRRGGGNALSRCPKAMTRVLCKDDESAGTLGMDSEGNVYHKPFASDEAHLVFTQEGVKRITTAIVRDMDERLFGF